MKIAINACMGGFRLNKNVYLKLGVEWNGGSIKNETLGIINDYALAYRSHPTLISAIEAIGEGNAGLDSASRIRIIEIPDGIEWEIYSYDGYETIHEKHRQWG